MKTIAGFAVMAVLVTVGFLGVSAVNAAAPEPIPIIFDTVAQERENVGIGVTVFTGEINQALFYDNDDNQVLTAHAVLEVGADPGNLSAG